MAHGPDNLILAHLREIRATLAEHSARFDRIDECFAHMDQRFTRIDQRFDHLEERFDDLHMLVAHTLTLSTSAAFKQRELKHLTDDLSRRASKLEEERGS